MDSEERAWRNGWGSALNALRAADHLVAKANVPPARHREADATIHTLVGAWIDSIESLTENFVDGGREIGFASEPRSPVEGRDA